MPPPPPISTLAAFALVAALSALASAQYPSQFPPAGLPSAPQPAVAALLAQVNPVRPTPGGQQDGKESAPEAQAGPLPVSYTHLDVYKRQEYALLAQHARVQQVAEKS